MIANIPDGRVIAVNRNTGEIVWDKKVASINEFGSQERFYTAPITADGKVIVANSAGDGKTRGWIAALDARIGQGALALVSRAETWRSGQRDLEGHQQRVEDRTAAASAWPWSDS